MAQRPRMVTRFRREDRERHRRPYGRYPKRELWLVGRIRGGYELLSLPLLTVFLFHNRRFDKAYSG